MAAVEAFLDKEAPGYPTFSLHEDGDDGWAFWVVPSDTTSYVHENLAIEWYGTSWSNNIPELDVGEFDPMTDTITIEGTEYSGSLFRSGFGSEAAIGQVLRIDKRTDGIVTVTRLRQFEKTHTNCGSDCDVCWDKAMKDCVEKGNAH